MMIFKEASRNCSRIINACKKASAIQKNSSRRNSRCQVSKSSPRRVYLIWQFILETCKKKSQRNASDVQLFMQKFSPTTVNTVNFDHGKQISPVIFYGSYRMPPKRPSRLLRLLHEIHIDQARIFNYKDQKVCMLVELFSNKS